MEIKAYAKINLTLDITGKRADGYHTIETVMQSVGLSDTITILESWPGEIKLETNKGYLPADRKNTAWQAAELFFQRTGIQSGVRIKIDKAIPGRAGMGGGSADAAAVLKGMNTLFRANLSREALLEMGEKIGADVPFCLVGGTCRCYGIGEKLEPVYPMPKCELLICKPPTGVSTPRAYAMADRYPPARQQYTQRMVSALRTGSIHSVARALNNRFEDTMRLQQVQEIKRIMLVAGALNAQMTGSGSAVFGIFLSRDIARSCAQKLQPYGELFLTSPRTEPAGE